MAPTFDFIWAVWSSLVSAPSISVKCMSFGVRKYRNRTAIDWMFVPLKLTCWSPSPPVWWCLEMEPLGVLWICQINSWLNGVQGAGWWAVFQQQVTREIEIGKFITCGSWKKYLECLKRPPVRSRQSTDRERQALVHIPCEGLWVGCFGVLKPRLVWSIESQMPASSTLHGGFIWGVCKGQAPGDGGDWGSQGLLGGHIRSLHLLVTQRTAI